MREVEKLRDRVAIIHRGRILAHGTISQLASAYGQPDMEELFFELIQRHDGAALDFHRPNATEPPARHALTRS
jgi:sodium transport system ATP-binding protein